MLSPVVKALTTAPESQAEVALFSVTPVRVVPRTVLIVSEPVPVPELVMVPALLTLQL